MGEETDTGDGGEPAERRNQQSRLAVKAAFRTEELHNHAVEVRDRLWADPHLDPDVPGPPVIAEAPHQGDGLGRYEGGSLFWTLDTVVDKAAKQPQLLPDVSDPIQAAKSLVDRELERYCNPLGLASPVVRAKWDFMNEILEGTEPHGNRSWIEATAERLLRGTGRTDPELIAERAAGKLFRTFSHADRRGDDLSATLPDPEDPQARDQYVKYAARTIVNAVNDAAPLLRPESLNETRDSAGEGTKGPEHGAPDLELEAVGSGLRDVTDDLARSAARRQRPHKDDDLVLFIALQVLHRVEAGDTEPRRDPATKGHTALVWDTLCEHWNVFRSFYPPAPAVPPERFPDQETNAALRQQVYRVRNGVKRFRSHMEDA